MDMRELDAIDADLAAVEAEGRDYGAETRRLIAQVEVARRDGINAIEVRVRAFKQERRERLDADAISTAHPWAGKRVEREEITYSRGNWTHPSHEIVVGASGNRAACRICRLAKYDADFNVLPALSEPCAPSLIALLHYEAVARKRIADGLASLERAATFRTPTPETPK